MTEPTHNNTPINLSKPLALEEAMVLAVQRNRADSEMSEASERMLRVCLRLWAMLDEKNRAYGNSALDPVRVFSRVDKTEQLRVRIDDKLSRLSRGAAAGEDAALDLMGYLVLLKVAEIDWDAPQNPNLFGDPKPFVRRNAVVMEKGDWKCRRCFFINKADAARCQSGRDCLAWKPTHPEMAEPDKE